MKLNKATKRTLKVGDILGSPDGCRLGVKRLYHNGNKTYITVECLTGPSWMLGRLIYYMGVSHYYNMEIIRKGETGA